MKGACPSCVQRRSCPIRQYHCRSFQEGRDGSDGDAKCGDATLGNLAHSHRHRRTRSAGAAGNHHVGACTDCGRADSGGTLTSLGRLKRAAADSRRTLRVANASSTAFAIGADENGWLMAASPRWFWRLFRTDGKDPAPLLNAVDRPNLTKHCTVVGCDGTMHFHARLAEAPAHHTLEWPWHASWICARNSAHFEVISDDEYRQVLRKRKRRWWRVSYLELWP
jgi:hypothetical protein